MKTIGGFTRRLSTLALIAITLLTACTPTTQTTSTPTTVPPTVTEAPQTIPPTPAPPATDITEVSDEGITDVNPTVVAEAISEIATGQLSSEEADGLRYMREEEKLARDVYLTLYDKWGLNIFQNIADSEQTHTDSVLVLLERYGLDDPAAGNDIGVFTNTALQELYNSLVEQGSQSLEAALRVGAAIEEIDIIDLEERLAQTDKEDITLVYENLMKGSRNHLRSFVSTLEREGATYIPQYLDQATYDAIIGTEIERGGPRRGQ